MYQLKITYQLCQLKYLMEEKLAKTEFFSHHARKTITNFQLSKHFQPSDPLEF